MPQWIGIATRASSSAAASAARAGIHVARPHRRPPAPDRQQRDVHRRELGHPGEDVGVAREVDRAAGTLDHVAERFRAGAERQPARVVLGGVGAHGQRADLDLLAGAHLGDVRDAGLRLISAPAPRGATTGISRPSRCSDGHVEVVVVEVRDQHGVDAAERAGIDLGGPAEVGDPVAEQRIGEELDACEIDDDRRVADVLDAGSRWVRTTRHDPTCAAPDEPSGRRCRFRACPRLPFPTRASAAAAGA